MAKRPSETRDLAGQSWRDALSEILDERRAAMGEPPSPETLIEFREGTLSDEARERVLERAAVDPTFAQTLLDVVDYPALAPAEEETGQDERDAEHQVRWNRFLEAAGDTAVGASVPVPGPLPRREPRPERRPAARGRVPKRNWAPWPMAASFLIGGLLVALFVRGLPDSEVREAEPQGNVEMVSLSLDREAGSRGGVVRPAPDAAWLLLTLGTARLPSAESYDVRIADAQGTTVWQVGGLVPGTGGLLTALVPTASLPPGGYLAEVSRSGQPTDPPLGSATWTIERAATSP